jgi:hypothetical protein
MPEKDHFARRARGPRGRTRELQELGVKSTGEGKLEDFKKLMQRSKERVHQSICETMVSLSAVAPPGGTR